MLGSNRPGAALLEGWANEARWRFILPWPEETRELAWERAADWQGVVRDLESELREETADGRLPFSGGWVGFIAYETVALQEGASLRPDLPLEPALFFARHSAGIAIDPRGAPFFFGPSGKESTYLATLGPSTTKPSARGPGRVAVDDSMGQGAYRRGVDAIRANIVAGNVYQVNLTRRFSSRVTCDPAELYERLVHDPPPRSAAFLRGPHWSIISASPEVLLHFQRHTGVAESQPIKGTVRRRGNDAAEIAALLASEKDASEHLMIVDVVRNDFGKIAPPGGVSVPDFRHIRSLPFVHHLESTVRAEGLQGLSVTDVLAALSPAASITGAPKRAAVQMIRELEPVSRGVYCGSIGVIHSGGASFSVAIRTAVATDTFVQYYAGGGIVWDSHSASEDDEAFAKAEAFLRYMDGLEQ